jgi:hypothetical protein
MINYLQRHPTTESWNEVQWHSDNEVVKPQGKTYTAGELSALGLSDEVAGLCSILSQPPKVKVEATGQTAPQRQPKAAQSSQPEPIQKKKWWCFW